MEEILLVDGLYQRNRTAEEDKKGRNDPHNTTSTITEGRFDRASGLQEACGIVRFGPYLLKVVGSKVDRGLGASACS